jgi:hypothetical protein
MVFAITLVCILMLLGRELVAAILIIASNRSFSSLEYDARAQHCFNSVSVG